MDIRIAGGRVEPLLYRILPTSPVSGDTIPIGVDDSGALLAYTESERKQAEEYLTSAKVKFTTIPESQPPAAILNQLRGLSVTREEALTAIGTGILPTSLQSIKAEVAILSSRVAVLEAKKVVM